jgi:hypothetical protein
MVALATAFMPSRTCCLHGTHTAAAKSTGNSFRKSTLCLVASVQLRCGPSNIVDVLSSLRAVVPRSDPAYKAVLFEIEMAGGAADHPVNGSPALVF